MYELCVRVRVRVYVCVRVHVHTVRLPHAVHTAVLPGGHTHKPPSPSWPLGRCAGCAQRPSRARPAGPRVSCPAGAGGGPSHGKGSLSPRRKPGLGTGHVRTKGLCEAQHSVCFWVTRHPSFSIWERDAFTATMVSITSGTAAYTGPARARPLHGPVPRRTARLGTRPPTETRAASPGLPGVPGLPAEGTSERLGHGRTRARAPAHFTADFFLFKYGDFDPLLPQQRRPPSDGTLRTVACAQTARVRRTSRPAPAGGSAAAPRLPARRARRGREDASRRKRASGSSVLVRTRRGAPLCPCV